MRHRCDAGLESCPDLGDLVFKELDVVDVVNWIRSARLQELVAETVLQLRQVGVLVPGKFSSEVVKHGLRGGQCLLPAPNLLLDLLRQDVHQHGPGASVGEIPPILCPQVLQLAEVVAQMLLGRALWNTMEAPETAECHLLSAAFMLPK